ncbi:hypothetical protein OPKNFCMD_1297 [Methylobacterium crusticola]|uniref:histidine kinase n=1 Tax=Methylobacterium crusticola TaxID=1697972 RepID=A0ABQ4QUJ1_9HYPH|nr:PAS domain-containing protein [Methylobacterium crusticola]GJD48575.1 hypothetical protein OPKNFCMD_1297 [Methylobacterium crusticola]
MASDPPEVTAPLDLAFSSREFLRLLEGLGLTGNWGWTFATDAHVWSPGLYRLLGLDPGAVRPSYELFLSLVDPEDRLAIESAAQVREGLLSDHTIRVIRPDGAARILSCRGEAYFAPDGSPRGAAGIVLDVTDRERLAAAQAAERRWKRALAEQARTVASLQPYLSALERPPGPAGPDRPAGTPAGPPPGAAPALPAGSPPRPGDAPGDAAGPPPERGLDQAIAGHHLRAARALLDWSMADLARASAVSLSTVRRLEEDTEGPGSARSRRALLAALRAAGIVFTLTEGATLVVGKP